MERLRRYRVRVQPRASRERVEPTGDGGLKVYVSAPPERGKANERVIRVLAEYFGCRRSAVRIVGGLRGRDKVVEIRLDQPSA